MRYIQTLNGIWGFSFTGDVRPEPPFKIDHSMVVPGCFDLIEPFCGKRGYAVYTRKVVASGLNLLEIDGAGVSGEVFWDGKKIGAIPYAYLPESFVFNAGSAGEHILAIVLNNCHHSEQFRADFDFFANGGIYGDVTLTSIPRDYISGVRISTEDYKTGKIRIQAEYSKKGAVPVQIQFDTGFQVGSQFADGKLDCTLTLPDYRLWSLDSPALHTVELTAGEDRIHETFGIREFTADGRKLLLNGKEVKLYGVNRHESHPTTGAAVPSQIIYTDVAMLKEAGFNFIRGSHYPQRKALLELCDRTGMLVWEETLGWDVKPPELFSRDFLRRQKDEARKLAAIHYNHPCIIIWAFMNETESQLPRVRSIIKGVYDAYREIDTTRPITYASNKYEKDVCMDLVDLVAMNPYPGWGGICWEEISGIHHVEPRFAEIEAAVPKNKPYMISETGGSAIYGEHDPYRARWSEEYQADLIREICRVVFSNPRYCGLSIWHFSDAKSYINGGRVVGFNDKGVLDRYRRPKLAWEVIRNAIREYQFTTPKKGKK